MSAMESVRRILRDALQIGERAERLEIESPLLGGMAEFDSMAVVTVVAMLEDELGIEVDDDELSADVFATVGSLCRFVDEKLRA